MPISFMINYIFGSAVITVSTADAENVLNLLHKNGFRATSMGKKKDKTFHFTIRLGKLAKVKALLDKSGIKVYSIRGKGLPFLLKRYRKRYGIAVGLLMFCTTIWVSRLFVWEVTFSGNENISDSVVEEQLLEAGFGVGTYIPGVDFYKLCNVFLQQTEDFSFVSVNMEGTTAKVELRERKIKDEETQYEASNLVAKYSGQIDSMTVYSGKTVVEKEGVVKEGELLVSGFVEKAYGFDIVRSSGSVYAYVTRVFEVEVPFEKDVKVYTGDSQKSLNISFFGNVIDVYSSIDGSIEFFDVANNRERLVLFDKIKLPLIMTETTHKEYRYETTTLDEISAKNEAEKEMSRILTAELADSEILERRTKEEITDSSYKLICEIYCLTDIALEKEIQLK